MILDALPKESINFNLKIMPYVRHVHLMGLVSVVMLVFEAAKWCKNWPNYSRVWLQTTTTTTAPFTTRKCLDILCRFLQTRNFGLLRQFQQSLPTELQVAIQSLLVELSGTNLDQQHAHYVRKWRELFIGRSLDGNSSSSSECSSSSPS